MINKSKINDYLKSNYKNVYKNKTFNFLPQYKYDFYLEDYNLLIDFNKIFSCRKNTQKLRENKAKEEKIDYLLINQFDSIFCKIDFKQIILNFISQPNFMAEVIGIIGLISAILTITRLCYDKAHRIRAQVETVRGIVDNLTIIESIIKEVDKDKIEKQKRQYEIVVKKLYKLSTKINQLFNKMVEGKLRVRIKNTIFSTAIKDELNSLDNELTKTIMMFNLIMVVPKVKPDVFKKVGDEIIEKVRDLKFININKLLKIELEQPELLKSFDDQDEVESYFNEVDEYDIDYYDDYYNDEIIYSETFNNDLQLITNNMNYYEDLDIQFGTELNKLYHYNNNVCGIFEFLGKFSLVKAAKIMFHIFDIVNVICTHADKLRADVLIMIDGIKKSLVEVLSNVNKFKYLSVCYNIMGMLKMIMDVATGQGVKEIIDAIESVIN